MVLAEVCGLWLLSSFTMQSFVWHFLRKFFLLAVFEPEHKYTWKSEAHCKFWDAEIFLNTKLNSRNYGKSAWDYCEIMKSVRCIVCCLWNRHCRSWQWIYFVDRTSCSVGREFQQVSPAAYNHARHALCIYYGMIICYNCWLLYTQSAMTVDCIIESVATSPCL